IPPLGRERGSLLQTVWPVISSGRQPCCRHSTSGSRAWLAPTDSMAGYFKWEAAMLPTFHLWVASVARSYRQHGRLFQVGGSHAADIPPLGRERGSLLH